jgi:DNA-binding winged helix-turn-helix (wHTH) protein
MPQQCYLIDKEVKFYFEGKEVSKGGANKPQLIYGRRTQPLDPLEAKVLKYMFEHSKGGLVSVDEIIKKHWPRVISKKEANKGDKKVLLKLLFGLRNKFRAMGFERDGLIANGPNYQITWHVELIDGLEDELTEIKTINTRYRLYIFLAVLFALAIAILPK